VVSVVLIFQVNKIVFVFFNGLRSEFLDLFRRGFLVKFYGVALDRDMSLLEVLYGLNHFFEGPVVDVGAIH
jgi:hypothetical protein